MPNSSEPHRVDTHVGSRVRTIRLAAGLSASRVAEAIGVTFPQLQKYESGANRISASKLWELSRVLGCAVNDFYDGLSDGPTLIGLPSPTRDQLAAVLETKSGLSLVEGFRKISVPVQHELAQLVRLLTKNAA